MSFININNLKNSKVDYSNFINFNKNEVHFLSTKKMNAVIRVHMQP